MKVIKKVLLWIGGLLVGFVVAYKLGMTQKRRIERAADIRSEEYKSLLKVDEAKIAERYDTRLAEIVEELEAKDADQIRKDFLAAFGG